MYWPGTYWGHQGLGLFCDAGFIGFPLVVKQPNKESSAHHANGILSNHSCPKTWSDTGCAFALSGKSSLKKAGKLRKTEEKWKTTKNRKTKLVHIEVNRILWDVLKHLNLSATQMPNAWNPPCRGVCARMPQPKPFDAGSHRLTNFAMPALIAFQSACMLWSQSPAKFCSSCTWHHCYMKNSSQLKYLRQQTDVNEVNANQNLPHFARGNSILSHSVFFKKDHAAVTPTQSWKRGQNNGKHSCKTPTGGLERQEYHVCFWILPAPIS